MDNTSRKIQEARFLCLPSDVAAKEFIEFADKKKSVFEGTGLEKLLLSRNEPIIDLALAEFATDDDVVGALYSKAQTKADDERQQQFQFGLKLACLSNQNGWDYHNTHSLEKVIGAGELERILNSRAGEELAAIFKNPRMFFLLKDLYNKAGECAQISDKDWRLLVYVSRENARLNSEQDRDSGPDFEYWDVHKSIFRLLEIAPPTPEWVDTLFYLLNGIYDPKTPNASSQIIDLLARWENVPSKEKSYVGYTDRPLTIEFVCLVAALYGRVFENNNFVCIGAANSDKPFLRCAFYGNEKLTVPDMKTGYERDKLLYLSSVVRNNNVILDKKLRRFLEEEQLGGPLMHLYRHRCEHLAKKWKWFDPRPVTEFFQEEAMTPKESEEIIILRKQTSRIEKIETSLEKMKTWLVWGFVILAALVLHTAR